MKKLSASEARVLVIGSGGREHAIGIELKANGVNKLFFVPGNGGTSNLGKNVDLKINDFPAIYDLAKKEKIDLIVVGPEDPLANGIVDFFRERSIAIVGPTKAAARIESSKIFARNLMLLADVPQPEFVACSDRDLAEKVIERFGFPVVLKVEGLAAGKGAFVCHIPKEAEEALKTIYEDNKFGAGSILVEECLYGQEMSVFVLCNESSHTIIGTAQDYKRLLDDDEGPNTGGMGSISPSPLVAKYRKPLLEKIENRIITPVLEAMEEKGHPFTGFLYCGLMVYEGEPSVVEFNCRLGDPETQVILPLLKESFFDLLWKAVNNENLGKSPAAITEDLAAAFVVKVAGGYPDAYPKGMPIRIADDVENYYTVIHAGTKLNEQGELVTNGGRVIGVVGLGNELEDAVDAAYDGNESLHFEGEFYRCDIGEFE